MTRRSHRIRRAVIGLVLAGVAVVTLGSLSTGDGSSSRRPPAYSGTYDHDVLERAAVMTQSMSTPNASSLMQDGRIVDEQLVRSHDPGFTRDLEAHQADIDRMLARRSP